jgi:hypothetical protein
VNPIKDASPESKDLMTLLATTLERLTSRVSRDLDVDGGESVLPDDPFWADTISRLADYARECAEVLDGPWITALLTARPDGLLQEGAPTGQLVPAKRTSRAMRYRAALSTAAAPAIIVSCPGLRPTVAHTYASN